MKHWRRRNVLVSALVLLLAAAVLQSSVAGTSSKPYLAGITPSPVAGGATATLTFTVTNKANPQTLGSLNLTAPSGFSTSSYVSTKGTVDSTSTSTLLKLRNLNLAPNATVTVTMQTTLPCAADTYPWSLRVKQSNDFNGPPGNDFTGNQPETQVTGGCKLDWGTEPASAVKGDTITGAPYDQSVTAPRVTVRAVDGGGNTITTINGLQVSLTNAATTGCPAAVGFAGTSATMTSGVATFTGLTSADAAFDCHLIGSATGYQSTPASGAFNISLVKATCSGSVGCSLPNVSLDGDTRLDSSTSNGSFRFLAIGPAEIPASVTGSAGGCANFKTIGGAIFDAADGGGTGVKTFRYYVDKSILPKQFQSTSGQQFLPICAGGARVNNGTVVPCTSASDTTGWIDKTLDSDGKMTSTYSRAKCDVDTGLWWGILPSFQDINPGHIDRTTSPLVTGWGGSTNARYFDISVPAPWDWRAGT
jgi:hypothetical protein